jgi:single-strand DNA-binding protein
LKGEKIMALNYAVMMGRLTKDPEIRYSQGATPMCIASFSLAVDRKIKRENEPTADFFNCTAFGKTGEFVEKYLKKGTKVVAQGRMQNDNYKDKNGNMVYSIKYYIEQIEFAESKKAGEEAETDGTEIVNNNPSAPDGFMQIPDDLGGLPFG